MVRQLIIAACLASMAAGCAAPMQDDSVQDAARVRDAWSHKILRYIHHVHHHPHRHLEVKQVADRQPSVDPRTPVQACDLADHQAGCETY